jgi:GNAT superfamily N-acetyltransferase
VSGTRERRQTTFHVRPLTPQQWPALEDLFADSAVCSRCWCMYWRIGSAYRKQPCEANRAAFHDVVMSGPPPGVLAFDGDVAVGWCQVTPRDALPALDRAWRLARVDDVPVWSISCFYVRKRYRRRGLTTRLIAEALAAARRAGAPALEAYPLDREQSPSATSTGVVSTFARAGFSTLARHVASRPIVRYTFESKNRNRT